VIACLHEKDLVPTGNAIVCMEARIKLNQGIHIGTGMGKGDSVGSRVSVDAAARQAALCDVAVTSTSSLCTSLQLRSPAATSLHR
jgi:hypothetical protein